VNRFAYPRIAAAATEMFLHASGNVGISRIGLFLQQTDNAHNHSRCTIPALESAFREERLLDGMKFVAFG
jgi:hypothetical protein